MNLLTCRKNRKHAQRATTAIGVQTHTPLHSSLHLRSSVPVLVQRPLQSSGVALQRSPELSFHSSSFSSLSHLSSVRFFKPDPTVLSGHSGIVWPECFNTREQTGPFVVGRNSRWPRLKPVTPAAKARSVVRPTCN